ncbi:MULTISPECIES: DNA-deoxyinosine glycosylase [Thiorhodovibrio]|uniref:DNA-deoxyinosine glycosylase n=1 Tax=Thiorhodovibrio TaxID=61593 RepID=UPI0019139C9C|nr:MULTISPECIES: DNA-deoxyinosine glycosylase [Thiorhodovibrio]MBK5967863.1 DNA-deoxyinosine glycosylase [Thiorhodovibrio winogradskyi]WPL14088.1 DNA-deoxyinosine glycosylase [Thiorhodovibrio litoralis]
MTQYLEGFPPILGPVPQVLVLGSMPSAASLREGQYYGHPRNAFWPVMARLFGWPNDLPYAKRCAALAARGVALWDVIGRCARKGSADAAIEPDSILVNPIAGLIADQPSLKAVIFNGGTAAREFNRRVRPALAHQALPHYQLPSTSPAMARLTLEGKVEAWRILRDLLADN